MEQSHLPGPHFHARSLRQELQGLCLLDRVTGQEAGCVRHLLWCPHEKGCFELHFVSLACLPHVVRPLVKKRTWISGLPCPTHKFNLVRSSLQISRAAY